MTSSDIVARVQDYRNRKHAVCQLCKGNSIGVHVLNGLPKCPERLLKEHWLSFWSFWILFGNVSHCYRFIINFHDFMVMKIIRWGSFVTTFSFATQITGFHRAIGELHNLPSKIGSRIVPSKTFIFVPLKLAYEDVSYYSFWISLSMHMVNLGISVGKKH